MKIEKAELSKKIDRVKNVVPRKGNNEALKGVLIKNGYLIASNTEMTVKARLKGIGDESFIVPEKAFDLIKSLPDGIVDITENSKNNITIITGKIKNSYQSFPAQEFPYSSDNIGEEIGSTTIDGNILKNAMGRVLYAIPDTSNNCTMTGLCMDCAEGVLSFVGLDGHVIAWEQIEYDGKFQLLIPKSAVEKLLALELDGDILIRHDINAAIFISEKYEVYTRLIDGEYFKYKSMIHMPPIELQVKRLELLEAITRAKICTNELIPTRFDIAGDELKLSIKDSISDYTEILQIKNLAGKSLTIAFNSKLVQESLKAFSSEIVNLNFDNDKTPMLISEEKSKMISLVLPVRIAR